MSARSALAVAGQFNKEKASEHGSLTPKNLFRRQKDHELMMRDLKKNPKAFHKPGSNKK